MTNGLNLLTLEDEDLVKPRYQGLDFETPMIELPSKPLPTTTGLSLENENPILSTTNTDFVSSIATPNSHQKKKTSFVDWWKNMEPDKKTALTRGLLSTGLNMMSLGGQTYKRPVSTLGVIGQSGIAGLRQYEDTFDREQAHGFRKDYLDLAKERNQMKAKAYGLKLDAATNAITEKQSVKKTKALKRIAQIDEKIGRYANNNSIVDSEAARRLQMFEGKNVSIGSTMNEEDRQRIVNSYNKERQTLLPLTMNDEEYEEYKQNEKEKIIRNESLREMDVYEKKPLSDKINELGLSGLSTKSGADKARGLTTEPRRVLDEATAQDFMNQAGGDKEKARELARQAGYNF